MTRGEPPTEIDVAIVNWNTSEAAIAAARAFAASAAVAPSVTVVDNRSAEDQRRALEKGLPPTVRLDLAETNLGYGGAANRALAAGGAELICVSNADVQPGPEALRELTSVAMREPRSGMVGPVFGGETDRYHAELPGATALLGQVFAGSFMRRPVSNVPRGEAKEVGQPSGACFVMRRAAWEEMGGFDEGFFLWYEDVDLAKRLHDNGFRNLVVGSATVSHAKAESFRQLDDRTRQGIRLASLRRYIGKHHPRLAPVAVPLLSVSGRLRARAWRGAVPAPRPD
jgi:N-acetylglucosaminyl-diphospho-decaprenol L-rhamnosyltransferase